MQRLLGVTESTPLTFEVKTLGTIVGHAEIG
jgi:hypothetical protein